eukprot:3138170-Pyramimonas_sp.AAC.1
MSWSIVYNQEWTSYEVIFDNTSMPGWIRTDETLSLVPDRQPPFPPDAEAFVQSVPWEDDGRFLCANLHWVRTGFGHCPSCNNPIKYNYNVAHDYLLQSYRHMIISTSLWKNGILLHVVDLDKLPHERDLYVGARVNRQRRASADVIYNISSNLKLER